MTQFILETGDLVLQLNDLTLAVHELALFVLQIKCLGVDELVQIIDPRQLLRDIVLKSSSLGSEV